MSVFWFFLFSPVFWTDSMTNIVGFWNASANPLGVPTYYFGRLYISPDLPWHYHFVWVGITGLISVLVLCIVGICWFGIRYVYRRERSSILSRMILAMLLILIGTFATSVFFHPRSYDGWRHIYYIYPSIIGLCLYALKRLAEQAKKPMSRFLFICVVALMSIDGVQAITFITHNHPYQFVYFNAFAGSYPQAKANFDFDYWGVSYKQLFEYLDSLSLMAPTYIYFEQPLPYVEEFMIPKLTKKGFMLTQHIEQTDLYVTIQRDHKEPAPVGFRKIFAATVRGADLSAVYASPSFSGGLYIGKAK